MIEIPLKQNHVVFIDDEDWNLVQDYKWYADYDHGNYYAKAHINKEDGRKTTLKMHRLILGLTDPTKHVDHKNHNGLDNRKDNIRVCTIAENNKNRKNRRMGV